MTDTDDRSPVEIVAEFQEAFKTSNDPELWKKLVLEELGELEQAFADTLKEMADYLYVTAGLVNVVGDQATIEFMKTIWDRHDRIHSMVQGAGLNSLLQSAFERVHQSNMSKLDDNGQPILREDGKVMKGPNYQPPWLLDLITGEAS